MSAGFGTSLPVDEQVEVKKVFVFGCMGTGKSSLCNFLMLNGVAETSLSATSVTKAVTEHADSKRFLHNGVEARPADVSQFNRTGVSPVRQQPFEFVEFPGFGETDLLTEIKNNRELLQYIADEKVVGFVYCTQVNNRLTNYVVDYLRYLSGLCGPTFQRSLMIAMTCLHNDMFEEDLCHDDADFDSPYANKIDDAKLDGLRGGYAAALRALDIHLSDESIFIVNSKPRPRDMQFYEHFLMERDSEGGEQLWRRNATYFSLEMRRLIIQRCQIASPVFIEPGSRTFSTNVCTALDRIAVRLAEDFRAAAGDGAAKLLIRIAEAEAKVVRLNVDVRVDVFQKEFKSLLGRISENQEFSATARIGDCLRVLKTIGVADNSICIKSVISDDRQEFTVTFRAQMTTKAVVFCELFRRGSQVNESDILVLANEVKHLRQQLPKNTKARQIEKLLKLLQMRRFEDYDEIVALMKQHADLLK